MKKKITIEISEDAIIKYKALAKLNNKNNKEVNQLYSKNYSTDKNYKDVVIEVLEEYEPILGFVNDIEFFSEEKTRLKSIVKAKHN